MKTVLLCLACLATQLLAAQTSSYESLTRTVCNALQKGQPDKLLVLFDSAGMAKLTRGYMVNILSSTLKEKGKPKVLPGYWEDEEGCKTRTASLLRFGRETLMLYILFNDHKQIQQVKFDKPAEQPFYLLQGYKGLAEVTNLYETLQTRDGLTLRGNVTFSDTAKKLPIVIFVHGSGPNDRDETMGPNKCFRDLAQGLAQKGIAGFRYDKRTYAYQFDMKPRSDSITLYEETINDAIDAVKRVKQWSFVDTNRVFVVGHSLGSMCAPKIAELGPGIRGIVMMAGPVTSLIDIIPQQVKYLAHLDDTVTTQEEMQINTITWMVDKIKSSKPGAKSTMLMGASEVYWQSIKDYNQVETAQKLTLPIFILNGERDYQVPMQEFKAWKDKLKDKPNVSFKSYPGLTHLFMPGVEGSKPGPQDYEKPQHIPQYVVDDLADFILSH